MDLQLSGKRAIVLGGTRGIGRAIADLLAEEGAHVAVCARNQTQLDETVASLSAKGVKAFGGAVDISDGAQLRSWIAEAAEQLGGVDVLSSNASALTTGNSEDEWRRLFEIDLMGAIRSFETALPHLTRAAAASGDAAFVMISSVSAAEASSGLSAYGAVKAALIHVAKGLAREHAAKGVRVNVVSPGTVFFEGGVWGNVKERAPDFFTSVLKRNPTGRMATPEEIAAATIFLASPASRFTTGANLVVDGAITSRVNF